MSVWTRAIALVGLVATGLVLSGSFPAQESLSSHTLQHAAKVAYLFSVALTLGVGVWQSFFFGLIAFKTLPRQSFGLLQSKLFPMYFRVLVVSNSLALLGFTYLRQGQHPREENLQAYILVGGLATWLVNLLVFEPLTSSAMFARHKFEREEKSDGKDIKESAEYK